MKFEHLIEINDPLNPFIDALSAAQLWRGLLKFVEQPIEFVLGLDRCEITARGDNWLDRELHYGTVKVIDHVVLEPPRQLRYTTKPSAQLPAGALTITIEAPDDVRLFMRFIYETFPQGHQVAPAEFQEVMKQAYRDAGIDIVKRIRDDAAAGKLQ
jgi:Domain of unknown function (DUF1857)